MFLFRSEGLKDPGVSGSRREERGGSGRSHHLRVQRAGPGQPQLHVHGDRQHGHRQGNRYHGNTGVTRSMPDHASVPIPVSVTDQTLEFLMYQLMF